MSERDPDDNRCPLIGPRMGYCRMSNLLMRCVVAVLLLGSNACLGQTVTRYVGTYLLHIDLRRSERSAAEVTATINVDASIPTGQGSVIIPLPFSVERAASFTIEPY